MLAGSVSEAMTTFLINDQSFNGTEYSALLYLASSAQTGPDRVEVNGVSVSCSFLFSSEFLLSTREYSPERRVIR